MGLLEHINILGDAFGICVVAEHFRGEADQLTGMEAATVGIEVVEQLFCGDVRVEGAGITEVTVP
mgnify:CR=1 FL=1